MSRRLFSTIHPWLGIVLVILWFKVKEKKCAETSICPAADCNNLIYPPKRPPSCPDTFTDVTTNMSICYKITGPTPFPPKCPYVDVAPFDHYFEILKDLKNISVWMPVRRNRNGTDFFQWTEPSKRYKTEVEWYYFSHASHSIVGKDCLLYRNASVVEVSCEDSHLGICAYHKLDQMHVKVCHTGTLHHECQPNDYAPDMNCFCQGSNTQPFSSTKTNRAEFLRFYQVNVYNSLTSENCTIGLEKRSDKYIWAHSQTEVAYDFWAPEGPSQDGTYGVITPKGWLMTDADHQPGCELYQRDANYTLKPKLILHELNSDGYLTVTVVNPNYLKWFAENDLFLFCFTDANPFKFLYRYKFEPITYRNNANITFKFEPIKQAPGNYWCESLKYPNLEPITSNMVFLRFLSYIPYEHVAFITIDYTELNRYSILEYFERLSMIVQSETFRGYQIRIMKITELNETSRRISLNLHFTSYFEPHSYPSAADIKVEYCRLKENIPDAFKDFYELHVEVDDFFNADYCFDDCLPSGNLTWPETVINAISFPQQFCFAPDHSRISRKCGGNFIDGARWLEKEPTNYECFNDSSITRQLQDILYKLDMTKFANVCTNYLEFQSIDVYLSGQILLALSKLKVIDSSNVTMLAEIIDNLSKIDRKALVEAQSRASATDTILYALNKIFAKSDEHFKVQVANSLWISRSPAAELSSAVFLFQNGSILTTNKNMDEIKDYQELESALIFSPELLAKLRADGANVTFIIFSNDALFNEKYPRSKGKRIFGTSGLFNESKNYDVEKRLFILQRNYNEQLSDCTFWKYGLEIQGSWQNVDSCQIVPPFTQCGFSYGSYFTLISSPPSVGDPYNITHNLEQLLQQNKTVTEIINTLWNVSERHEEMSVYDVSLIAKVLAKLSDSFNNSIDLEIFTEIMNNLMEIDRKILATSQKEANSTDLILHNTDKILQNRHCTELSEFSGNNFSVITWNPGSDISGVIILNNDESIVQETLQGNVDIDQVLQTPNLLSVVFFTPKLLAQMTKQTKIIVTIYENTVLFNGKSTEREISRIFGVTVTDVGEFQSPILIYHKVGNNTDFQKSCSYWNYNEEGSTWRKDNTGSGKTVIECRYWHTTHFALLLLDKDYYDYDMDSLDWITSINCILSIFGLAAILLTAILFKSWRRNMGNQILVHFVIAIAMQIVTFYVSNVIKENSRHYLACMVIGVALHYSLVSQFCWMFIIAILQFRRFVEVLGGPPKYILLKACLCGWILPLLPVLCVLILDSKNYVGSKTGLCYPSGLSLYLGVWLPLAIIVVINFVIFIYIMYNVLHKKTECADPKNNDDKMFQWRLAVLLFFMLGLTWAFGFLSELEFGMFFVYLFCITATLQGFIMFLFFIVFNSATRKLYIDVIKKSCQNN